MLKFLQLVPIKENLYKRKNISNLVISSISKSMNELGAKKIFCIMLHRVEDINLFEGYVIKF